MNTSTSSPLPIAAIPVERFVERLYAPLAWEATVRLGDPAIASRIVERVLHRAWTERERFATFEALYRHAQDAALSAVQREADRRRDVTRFDGDEAHTPVPGTLELMAVDAVRRRIGEGRPPVSTPPAVAVVAAPAPAATAPESSSAVRPAPKPRLSMSSARVAPTPARAPRRSSSINRFAPPQSPQLRLSDDQRKLAIGGGALVVAIITLLALRSPSSGDPQARAFAALSDTTGPAHRSARAQVTEVPLLEGSSARLGASASVAVNTTFGDGARALRLHGPVSLSLQSDSGALAAIRIGTERFITAGAVAAFAEDSAGRVLVQVDSGDLVLVRDSTRIRLTAGSVVRIGTGAPMPITRDLRDAVFGWRQGRLRLTDASLGVIAIAARQWFDVDVRYPSDRAPTETASIDVPLGSRDSLVAALEAALRLRADVSGDRVTLKPAAAQSSRRAAPPATPRAPALAAPALAAPALSLPSIPPTA